MKLIDGEARLDEVKPSDTVPVLVLDVDDETADRILATYDPLSALAGVKSDALKSLTESVRLNSEALRKLLVGVRREVVIPTPRPSAPPAPGQSSADVMITISATRASYEEIRTTLEEWATTDGLTVDVSA